MGLMVGVTGICAAIGIPSGNTLSNTGVRILVELCSAMSNAELSQFPY
jgi:hypothetical protein